MTIPFESCAKLIRTIAPPVRKVLFYDGATHPAWISDGMEEPELRSAVVLLMAERSRLEDDVAAFPIRAGDALETFFLFAVRDEHGGLTGLLGVLCRSALATTGPVGSEVTRRLLAPVLDVYKYCLSHSAPGSTAAAPRIARNTTAMPETPAAGDGANFCDKVLRQTAAEVGCSFAAVVMPSCGVSHYWSSENESDLAMDAAVQSVHAALFKWMAMKRQPTAINRTGGIHSVTARYKIAAAPILDPAGQVLGLMLLFRQSFAANFLPSDLECARAACRSLEKSRAPRIDHVPSMSSASSVAR